MIQLNKKYVKMNKMNKIYCILVQWNLIYLCANIKIQEVANKIKRGCKVV